jgi:hypothetical protein
MAVFLALYSIGLANAQADPNIVKFAPEFSLGLGFEMNANSRENFAFGGMLQMEYRFMRLFSAGIKGVYSMNLTGVKVVEGDAVFRWNAVSHTWKNGGETAFFLQGEGGVAFGWEQNPAVTTKHGDGKPAIDPSGGITAGVRITFPVNLYLEPYGRFGYPYTWSGGIAFGYSFKKKPQSVKESATIAENPSPLFIESPSQPSNPETFENPPPEPIQESAAIAATPPAPPYEYYNVTALRGKHYSTVAWNIAFCAGEADFSGLDAEEIEKNNQALDEAATRMRSDPTYYAPNYWDVIVAPPPGLWARRIHTITNMLALRGVEGAVIKVIGSGI